MYTGNILCKQNMQMGFFHEVLGIDKQVLDKHTFVRYACICWTCWGNLGTQWQTYYGAIEESRLAECRLIEKFFELFELDRVVVRVDITFQIEIGDVAAFGIVCETLVWIDKCHLLAAQY